MVRTALALLLLIAAASTARADLDRARDDHRRAPSLQQSPSERFPVRREDATVPAPDIDPKMPIAPGDEARLRIIRPPATVPPFDPR